MFPTSSMIENSRNQHCSEENSYPCLYCSEVFSEESVLKLHEVVHASEIPYECDFCCEKFYVKYAFEAHIPKCGHTRGYPLVPAHKRSSELGVKKFPSLSDFTMPKSFFSGRFCKICEKAFPSKSRLRLHNRLDHKIKSFEPKTCEKFKIRDSSRRRHSRSAKSYGCEFCGEKFQKRHSLVKHKRFHSDEKDMCDKFSSFSLGPLIPELHECSVCMKKFSDKCSFRSHRLTHEKQERQEELAQTIEELTHAEEEIAHIEEKIKHAKEKVVDEQKKSFKKWEKHGMGNCTPDKSKRELARHKFCHSVVDRMRAKKEMWASEISETCEEFSRFNLDEQRPDNSEQSYKCEFCKKKFKDANELNEHECEPTEGKTL